MQEIRTVALIGDYDGHKFRRWFEKREHNSTNIAQNLKLIDWALPVKLNLQLSVNVARPDHELEKFTLQEEYDYQHNGIR